MTRRKTVKNWGVGQLHNRVVLTLEGQDYLLPLSIACYMATNIERQALIIKTESRKLGAPKEQQK